MHALATSLVGLFFLLGPGPAAPRTRPVDDAAVHLKEAAEAAGRDAAPRMKQRGVSLGLFAEDAGFSYAPLLAEIAALGATHVALVVPLYQTNGGSHDLALHTRLSPTLMALSDAIRAAHRERLAVTVFPIVRLAAPRAPDEWRGTLKPADRAAWFSHYGDVLGDIAAVAAVTRAERLAIGSELSTLDGEADLPAWRALIEKLRGVFAGPLLYSANWDHFRDARLLDLVDEDGVVAYFPLRPDVKAPAGVDDLGRRWRDLRVQLERWEAERDGRPLVLTEVGYRSRAGATATPWDEGPGGRVDLDEQRRAFEAFRRVWAGADVLSGVYVWNWYGWGGPRSTGYTPRGKPAADEVRLLLQDL